MRINLRLDGSAEVKEMARVREDRVQNMRPAFTAMADDFLELESQVWRTQGRIFGRAWRPLSPQWAAYKAKKYPGAGILEMDGRLRRSLTQRGAAYARRSIDGDEVQVGTRLGIAGIHQRGGSAVLTRPYRRTVQIPQRRMVRLRRTDRERWVGYTEQYLSEGRVQLRGVGL